MATPPPPSSQTPPPGALPPAAPPPEPWVAHMTPQTPVTPFEPWVARMTPETPMSPTPAPTPGRPSDRAARQRGLLTTAIIVGVCLVVALLADFVWPSPPPQSTGSAARTPVVVYVDATGPVGRIGGLIAGRNTGSTDPVETPATGDFAGRIGTGSISGPIGGFEVARGELREAAGNVRSSLRESVDDARGTVRDALGTPRAAVGGAAGSAQATVGALRATATPTLRR